MFFKIHIDLSFICFLGMFGYYAFKSICMLILIHIIGLNCPFLNVYLLFIILYAYAYAFFFFVCVLACTSNVFHLLARREVSPQTKRSSRKLWGEESKSHLDSFGPTCQSARDPRRDLLSW